MSEVRNETPQLDPNWIVHLELPLHMVGKVLEHLRRGPHVDVNATWVEISAQVRRQIDEKSSADVMSNTQVDPRPAQNAQTKAVH